MTNFAALRTLLTPEPMTFEAQSMRQSCFGYASLLGALFADDERGRLLDDGEFWFQKADQSMRFASAPRRGEVW